MGGYIAQELAVNYPERVMSLILGCTSAGGPKAVQMGPERLKKFTANEGLSPEQILQKDMDIYFSDKFVRENSEKVKEFIEISLQYYQPPDAFMRQFDACLKHDTVDSLHRIKGPVLILSGDDDPLVPPENSNILKELIPHAELVFFSGGRHCFFIEEAERFNHEAIKLIKSAQTKNLLT